MTIQRNPARVPRHLTGLLTLGMLSGACAFGASDWNQWRGPNRSGIAPQGPELAEHWPAEGPKKIWESEEKIPAGSGVAGGGYGSVVFSDGRLYLLATPKHSEALVTRQLVKDGLKALGWIAEKPPEALLKAIDEARVSEERAALDKDNRKLRGWVKEWVDAHVPADQAKAFGAFATDRLTRGKNALDLALLEKLVPIKDKEFANAEELDKWFADNGIDGEAKKQLAAKFPSSHLVGEDVIYCLDATNGKTLWKQAFPGVAREHGSSSTPCIADGRCYVLGSDGGAYCLDAKSGEKVWEAKTSPGDKACSFLVVDGVAVAASGPLTGFEAATGKVLWTQEKVGYSQSSPVSWTKDGKTSILVRSRNKTHCVDQATGAIRWEVDGGGISSPAVLGDRMALWNGADIVLYKLSETAAERAWAAKCPSDYGASPTIVGEHVYALGGKAAQCMELETGKVLWQDTPLEASDYMSPVFVDGKVLTQGSRSKKGGMLVLLKLTPEKGEVLSEAKLGLTQCVTPAIADGRIYVRQGKGVACYDMRKTAE
ncbi:MAG: PQQ-like beta-propeller repeat protein [Planctomycetes bacterium]|nr:PQQ-like beta-propeller repeat protein [Planctomycetota bacterium]